MTNWRERGYVPASDGEDSEGELSTQEDIAPFGDQSEHVQDLAEDRDDRARKITTQEWEEVLEGKIDGREDNAKDVPSDNVPAHFVGIEKALDVTARVREENKGNGLESREQEVPVANLSYQVEELDADGGVQLGENKSFGKAHTPKPRDKEIRNVSSPSPDPITGEPQKLSRGVDEPHTTPRPRNFTENTGRPLDISSVQSSPLSSAPPSPILDMEMTPPSSIAPSNLPFAGFDIVITNQRHPAPPPPPPPADFLSGPVRSLRQRKPIQLNPYLIEQERYRQTLKARGLQPVRIHEVREKVNRQHGGKKDSQEDDYVAPPERDEESQIQGRHVPQRELVELAGDLPDDEFPDVADLLRERPRPNGALLSGVKRRKVNHTYSGYESGASASKTKNMHARKQSSEHRRETDRNNTPRNHNLNDENGMDVYDLPPASPPTRPPRAPLTQRLNPPTHATQEFSVSQIRNLPKNREFLSILDSSDTESEPSRHRRAIHRSISPVRTERPRPLSISSSLSSQSSSLSSNSNSEESSEEDESLKIHKLQRKTNGVLPASWWRLYQKNQRKSTANYKDRNRDRRRSATPTRETAPRPGIARARISSRPRNRTPETNMFLFGDESDESSNEPVLVAPSATAPPARDREVALREWIDLDDVVEDDRIDPMLPPVERRKPNIQGPRKKRLQGTRPSSSAGGQNNWGNSGVPRQWANSSHPKQTKITSHVISSKSKSRSKTTRRTSTAPRLGVVDAVHHYKTTTNKSPPAFLNVAERSARARNDYGRQSPSRKLFVLESATDTREVQSVLRAWREGTIAIRRTEVPHSYAIPESGRMTGALSHKAPHQFRQTRIPSPQPLRERHETSLALHLQTTSAISGDLTPLKSREKQTTLNGIATRQPVSKRAVESAQTRKPSQPKPLAIISGARSGQTFLNPKYLAGYSSTRPHQFPVRPQTPALVDLLQDRRAARLKAQRNPNFGRFMEDEDLVMPMYPRSQPTTQTITHEARTAFAAPDLPEQPRPMPRARRKNTPRRIDADTIERRQPQQHDVVVSDDEPTPMNLDLDADDRPVLTGLSPPGFKYSLNFDTTAMKPGTIFNTQTFIGSGGLSRALNTQPAGESRANRGSAFVFDDMVLHWGVYEDSVASEFETIMERISDMVEKAQEKDLQGQFGETDYHIFATQAYSFYGFFARYLAEVLSFSDSVDLVSFGQRVLQAVDSCSDRISADFCGGTVNMNIRHASTRLCLRTHAFSLLFAFQISQLSSGNPEIQTRFDLNRYFRKLGHHLLRRLLKCGFDGVRTCYEDQRQRIKFERGIGYEHYVVETWVMAMKVLDHAGHPDVAFWQLLNTELRLEELEKSCDVRAFEKCWRIVFTLLPLYQFDNSGVVLHSHGGHPSENWALLKVLTSRPLKIYNANQEGHSGTINDYCRIIYARCYHLITKWDWTNPEMVVPVLYEFFASSSLANLKKEADYGSPNFLQNLDKDPSLEIQDSDRCFHLLLKTIAVALQKMKSTSTTRKISSLVNRLMPNHRRQYPKEDELRVEHLTALRNHHDLLITLYWAAPPDCRPPLDAVRNLVNPEMSHRQACNVSIRAWSNLIRFQLHSNEGVEALAPLMEWFDEFTCQTLNQHNNVKSEVERQFNTAKARGDTDIEEDMLQDIVRRNQRQLDGILLDAVKSLGVALAGIAGDVRSAMAILTKASISSILNSYNRLSHKLILEVLEILQKYINVCTAASNTSSAIAQFSEDSQDYGDWSAFDDLIIVDGRKGAAEHLMSVAYDSLHRMLSNCLGADKQPEESLLVKMVDTWSLVAGFLVQHGLKTWDTYLNSYSRESWSSLRDTEQTRKFTAYFMLRIIHSGSDAYESNKNTFLSFWLRTLVERESMLKFQNEFTSTLLNVDEMNPILANLPFAKDEVGVYRISGMDFRARRLSLVSTVLANMRESHELALQNSPGEAARLKQEYAEMLKAMMKAMRENYEELQAKAVPGAYVEFVQQVIECLQHHTIDLVTIDKFFTDSTAFPLPATDPTYVIGKLKNYGLKLAYPRSHKQLIFFFQSVCERAAVDGLQEYLVGQLATALSGDFEAGDRARPTLRTFFLQAIFPVYMEEAFGHAGWILAVPILKAAGKMVRRLGADVDSTLYGCVKEVLGGLACLVDAVRRGVGELVESPGDLTTGRNLGILSLVLNLIAKIMPMVDCLASAVPTSEELKEPIDTTIDSISFLLRFSSYIQSLLLNQDATKPVDVRLAQVFPGNYEQARKDCERSLKDTLSREWSFHTGGWYVVRGASRRAVNPPALVEVGGGEFGKAVEETVRVACRTERWEGVARMVGSNIWEMESRGWSWNGRVRRQARSRAVEGLAEVFC